MAAPKKYPDELRERAVRLYRESEPTPVIRRLAEQLGVHHEAVRNWIRQQLSDLAPYAAALALTTRDRRACALTWYWACCSALQ